MSENTAFALVSVFHTTAADATALSSAFARRANVALSPGEPNLVTSVLYGGDGGQWCAVEVYATSAAFDAVQPKPEIEGVTRRTAVTGVPLDGVRTRLALELQPAFGDNSRVLAARPPFTLGMGPRAAELADERDAYPALLELRVPADDIGALDRALERIWAPAHALAGLCACAVLRDGVGAVPARRGAAEARDDDDFDNRIHLVFASGAAAASAVPALVKLVEEAGGEPATLLAISDRASPGKLLADALAAAKSNSHIKAVQYQKVVEGFVLHPGLCTGADDVDESALATSIDETTGDRICRVRFNSDGTEPRMFIFRDSEKPFETSEENGKFSIPLRALLRKLLGRDASKPEIAAENVFPQLARLRGLRDDILALDAYLKRGNEALDTLDAHRVRCVLSNLESFGFTLPDGTNGIEIPHLGEFVTIVEDAYSSKVHGARRLLASDGAVEYGSLFEVYHIGDIVTAPASTLGGTTVAYRVCDVFYSTLRSAFGAKKLSLHLALEMVISLGDCYAFVSFEEPLGDWEGTQRVANLPYHVLDVSSEAKHLAEIRDRGEQVLKIGFDPAYRSYREQCFFGHGAMGRGTASSKLAAIGRRVGQNENNEENEGGSGRLVVDTRRGLALGHNVAMGNDPVSLAVLATVKAYRTVQRARGESGDTNEFDERVKAAGLRLVESFAITGAMAHMAWPALVAFSLGLKRWGHVLVNGLAEVKPNSDAWDRLVLPKSKKELLLSLVQASFDPNAPRLRDLVHNKGSGSLFLLHGVPGTGKTLTVEALAEKYAVPCYYLTFGELGTSVKELEATMGDVLALCSGWGALVLLDEGDALVERREKGALLLNSMVGVLLKSLDAFEGLLFITTNRVASFDPAALSRVTLSIRYGSLKKEGRKKVWANVIERAGADPANFDLEALAARGGSGRDINSAARLALTLSYFRRQPLDQAIFMEVLDIADDFKSDFGDGMKAHADGGRISDDED